MMDPGGTHADIRRRKYFVGGGSDGKLYPDCQASIPYVLSGVPDRLVKIHGTPSSFSFVLIEIVVLTFPHLDLRHGSVSKQVKTELESWICFTIVVLYYRGCFS